MNKRHFHRKNDNFIDPGTFFAFEQVNVISIFNSVKVISLKYLGPNLSTMKNLFSDPKESNVGYSQKQMAYAGSL
jgi:hypothetical protein